MKNQSLLLEKNHNLLLGIFTTVAVLLFGAGLFFLGDQHKAFAHHVIFYTNFQNVEGLTKGTKVTVEGMVVGEVDDIQIPSLQAHQQDYRRSRRCHRRDSPRPLH